MTSEVATLRTVLKSGMLQIELPVTYGPVSAVISIEKISWGGGVYFDTPIHPLV